MPFGRSETAQNGAIWKAMDPFDLGPKVIWTFDLAVFYIIQVANFPDLTIRQLLLGDWFTNARWAGPRPNPEDILLRTQAVYNAKAGVELLSYPPRQGFILGGFSPQGLHLHLDDNAKCGAASLVGVAAGTILIDAARAAGAKPGPTFLIGLAVQIILGIVTTFFCQGAGNGGPQPPQSAGTPDPWGYYGR